MTSAPRLEQHLEGIEAATRRLVAWATAAGLDTAVPTCPDWSVRDLVAHQGMVHRWASAMLRGGDPRVVGIDATRDEAAAAPDPLAWLRTGADELLATLGAVPDDLEAFTFLREAPPARLFWARRQHHETTMHALDALAAAEGRSPCAADAWFGADVSTDAVDELLVGFWPRRGRGPRAEAEGYRVLVAADEGDRWVLDVGPDTLTARRLADDETGPEAALPLSGPAVELHLGLWNRGGRPQDPSGLLTRWRTTGRVV